MRSSLLAKRHSSGGASTRKLSVWFSPMGSSPSSSEPVRATTPRTSGTCAMMARCTLRSMSRDCSRLMDGSFSNCTMRSPSSMVGMKVLPTRRYSAPATTSSASASTMTTHSCRSAQRSDGA